MNKNEKFVITINRELGSGGRTVGDSISQTGKRCSCGKSTLIEQFLFFLSCPL